MSGILAVAGAQSGTQDGIEGIEQIDKVIEIDWSPIGRTPRSNPDIKAPERPLRRARQPVAAAN